MTLSRKPVLALAASIVAIIALAYVAGYIWASRTEPFHVACHFAQTDSLIGKWIGQKVVCRLRWTGYSIEYHGPRGQADFAIDLHGTRGDGVLFVKLGRHLGEWQIQGANLRLTSGRLVSIHPPETSPDRNTLPSD